MHNAIFCFFANGCRSNPARMNLHRWSWAEPDKSNKKKEKTSLATELFWMFQATVVVTSQCVLQSRRMESSTAVKTPYDTDHILTFLDTLHNTVTAQKRWCQVFFVCFVVFIFMFFLTPQMFLRFNLLLYYILILFGFSYQNTFISVQYL